MTIWALSFPVDKSAYILSWGISMRYCYIPQPAGATLRNARADCRHWGHSLAKMQASGLGNDGKRRAVINRTLVPLTCIQRLMIVDRTPLWRYRIAFFNGKQTTWERARRIRVFSRTSNGWTDRQADGAVAGVYLVWIGLPWVELQLERHGFNSSTVNNARLESGPLSQLYRSVAGRTHKTSPRRT